MEAQWPIIPLKIAAVICKSQLSEKYVLLNELDFYPVAKLHACLLPQALSDPVLLVVPSKFSLLWPELQDSHSQIVKQIVFFLI